MRPGWRVTDLSLNGPLVQLFISAFVTLFVVIDPPGCVPIFSSLTAGTTPKPRRDMAVRSSLIAAGVLIAFALGGEAFLSALGITLPAFKIAGGLMVFVIAIDMVFEKRTQRRETRAEGVKSAADAAGIRLHQSQHHLHGDGGIQRRSAGTQDAVARIGGQRMRRRHHEIPGCPARFGRPARG